MGLRAGVCLLLAAAIGACAPESKPRTVLDFMEDGLAREGVLTRCNQDRDATLQDVECANARRASATLAIEAERARAGDVEHAREPKLAVLPSTGGSTIYADQGRRSLDVDAKPPTNDIAIVAPQIEIADVAVIPRPFRTDDVSPPR